MLRTTAHRALRHLGLLAAGLGVLDGCARDPTVTITLTAAELQEQLNRKLPLKRAGRLVTVTVQSAQVVLVEGSDRVGVRAAAELALPMGRALSGTVRFDGKIRYVPDPGEFWFDDARVVDLEIGSLPGALRPTVEELVGVMGRNYLARTPVYRLKPGQVKHSLARLLLRSAVVRDGKLVLTLGLPAG
ncbi:MAG: DUF1439 domain-containing protein [Deltaproteobacteria bacterium]|nr:DUF1439 domain-containing protein [Deltaproteobacteria bacterium]